MIKRGNLKLLILHILRDRPMHGYMIMEAIGEEYGGLYVPSPGAAYPRLEVLVDQGYVEVATEGEKKIYSITERGLEFLRDNKERVDAILERRSRYIKTWGRIHSISRKSRGIAVLVSQNLEELTEDQIVQIEKIIDESRRKVASIIFGGEKPT